MYKNFIEFIYPIISTYGSSSKLQLRLFQEKLSPKAGRSLAFKWVQSKHAKSTQHLGSLKVEEQLEYRSWG